MLYNVPMNIYLTRHGETRLNKQKLMQGSIDEPLNDVGISQAEEAHESLKDVKFDAVYASPLIRAVKTASIIAGVPESEVIRDERIKEVYFGDYELRPYSKLGFKMTIFWLLPEVFKAPKSVEPIPSMVARSKSFIEDLAKENYENVLIVCHGGIIRALCGVLEKRKNGIKWRPKPHNCEIRKYQL